MPDRELGTIIDELNGLQGLATNPLFNQKLDDMADRMEHQTVEDNQVQLEMFFRQYPDSFAPLIIKLIHRRKAAVGDIDREALAKINALEQTLQNPGMAAQQKTAYCEALFQEHEKHYGWVKRWFNRLIKLTAPLAAINGLTGGKQFAEALGLSSTLTWCMGVYGYQCILAAFAWANIPKDHVDIKGFTFAVTSATPSVIVAYGAAATVFDSEMLEILTVASNFLANVALDTRSYAEGLNAIELFKLWYKSKTTKQKIALMGSFVGLSLLSIITLISYILGSFDFVGDKLGAYPKTPFLATGVYLLGGTAMLTNAGMYSMLMMTLFRKKLTVDHIVKVLRGFQWTVNIPRGLMAGERPFKNLWENLNRETAIATAKTGLQVYMGGSGFVAYSGMVWTTLTRLLLWAYCWMSLSQDPGSSGSSTPAYPYCNATVFDHGVIYPKLYSCTSSQYPVPTIMDFKTAFGTLVTVAVIFVAGLAGIGAYENYARFGDTVYAWLESLVKNAPLWKDKILAIFKVIQTWIGTLCYPKQSLLPQYVGQARTQPRVMTPPPADESTPLLPRVNLHTIDYNIRIDESEA